MKTGTAFIGIVIVVALIGFFVFSSSDNVTGNVVAPTTQQGALQKVVLSQEGYNYKDVTVPAGKPLSISADSSVGGCLRSVVISVDGQKYGKYLRTPEETFELPALKKGIYPYSCSMGMGQGRLIVN